MDPNILGSNFSLSQIDSNLGSVTISVDGSTASTPSPTPAPTPSPSITTYGGKLLWIRYFYIDGSRAPTLSLTEGKPTNSISLIAQIQITH